MSQATDATTDAPYSTEELLAAGASRDFAGYYQAAKRLGERPNAVAHIESEHRSLERVADAPDLGGGFFAALWKGEPRWESGPNPYGADSQNKRILAEANVAPYSCRR